MARPKEFDQQRALDAAMHVFWEHGYEATSVEMLMSAMGIARQSLYDTFSDKRALFLLALAHYREQSHAGLRALFSAHKSIRDAFARLLFDISAETPATLQRGCLLLSANLQGASDDTVLAEFLRGNQWTVESIFSDALRTAQDRGEVSQTLDPTAVARFFVATIQGMRSTGRLVPDRLMLEQIAQTSLAVLG